MTTTKSLILILLAALPSQARLLDPSEADYSIESQVTEMKVFADGKSVSHSKFHLKALNENGRLGLGTLRFNYRPTSMRLKVTKASVTNGNTVTEVTDEMIVDQRVGTNESGYDETRQAVVAFPHVHVGTEFKYILSNETFKPDIPGQFSFRFDFGKDELAKKIEYRIRSKKPLHLEINDPGKNLLIESSRKKDDYFYSIRLKAPLFYKVSDEALSSVDDSQLTWVIASTAPDYHSLFAKMAHDYETALARPLPGEVLALFHSIRNSERTLDQVNDLTSVIMEKFRYMGDWRSVDGHLIPNSLAKIAQTRSGDCKDLSLLTAKLLREFGYKASIALVHRGTHPPSLSSVPYLAFNHAIVYAELDGRKLWIDPTNFQSYAQGVFEDIADREALVLDPAAVRRERISFGPPNESTETSVARYSTDSKGQTKVHFVLQHTGSKALPETGAFLRASKSQIEENTAREMGRGEKLHHFTLESSDLSSRVVRPVEIKMSYESFQSYSDTSLGPAIPFTSPALIDEVISIKPELRNSDVRLGVPSISDSLVIHEKTEGKGLHVTDCVASSPWLDYRFSFSTRPVSVKRSLHVKTSLISAKEVRSAAFMEFQKQLEKCGKTKYIIFNQHPR